ncbi:hypothetical protein [Marinospirillum perlucidum]|uniref:hypothetical protein n=1 Tax=Marinospirillum perlucidum TaxID=1982602 RepID=UPI000DF408AB|nr:hypothetical protein [Marinospirillum perlucidum]
MKKLLLALVAALLVGHTALTLAWAGPHFVDGDCDRRGGHHQQGGHHHGEGEYRHHRGPGREGQPTQRNSDPLTAEEITTLAEARALMMYGSGSSAQVTELEEGGYQVEIMNAEGEVKGSHELNAQGFPQGRHHHYDDSEYEEENE